MSSAYFRVIAYLIAGAATAAALAGPARSAGPARVALGAEAQADHAAVARLNVAGQGVCTATLIAPDLALTAAHCLDPRGSARRVAPERLNLLAGWRMGAFVAHYRGAAAAVLPGWTPERLDRDLALIRVAPVSGEPDAVVPVPLRPAPGPGAAVATLSYGRDRPEILSRQGGCRLETRRGDLLLSDCEATPGVSGAPLIVETEHGPALIGVVVAARGARPPALRGAVVAVAAEPLLPALRAALARVEAGTGGAE